MGECYQHVTLGFHSALAVFLRELQCYNTRLLSLQAAVAACSYQLLEVTRKSNTNEFSLKGMKIRDQ